MSVLRREQSAPEEPGQPDHAESSRLINTVKWLADHHHLPFSLSATNNTLPDHGNDNDPSLLARALAHVGLQSEIVRRSLRSLDPVTLPVIAFAKDGSPIIVTACAADNKTAVILQPNQSPLPHTADLAKLQKSIQPDIMLVTPIADATVSRLSPDTQQRAQRKEHWLWAPLRQNSNAWLQVLVAALGINVLGLALPIFVMNVYDRVIPNLAFVTLWTLAGGVALALFLDLVMKAIRTSVLETTSRRIDLKVASKLFQTAMNIELLSRPGGSAQLVSHIRDFDNVRDFFVSSSLVALIDLMFVGIFVAVLWVIVGPIALVPLLAVPLVIVISLLAQIPIGASVKKSQQMATKRHIVLVESLSGIETVKSLNAEPVMQREWENAVAASTRINGKTRFWSNFAMSTTMLIQQTVSVVIIVLGVYLVSAGLITVGGLIAANILAGRILAPLGNISQTLIRAQQAIKSVSSLNEFMRLPLEKGETIPSTLKVKHGAIRFDQVSFTYPDAPQPAADQLSFEVKPGETVALLGRVGSGKSTIGKLMNGLLDAESGLILVDEYELAQYDRTELRDGIGYLPQEAELFTGTIRENLVLGVPRATDDEIKQALYYAGMDRFIAENPEGLNQFVGEKGNRLSGGQKQAINLARLILRKPKTMFLDEPTNAMDNATEAIVTERLRELAQKGTALMLSTHRHSLAMIASRIIVIDRGRKLLDGPRDEVMATLRSGAKTAPTHKTEAL